MVAVSFSKVASVYRTNLLDPVVPRFSGFEPSFLFPWLSAFRGSHSFAIPLRGTRASRRYDSDRVIRGWDSGSLSPPPLGFQPCCTR